LERDVGKEWVVDKRLDLKGSWVEIKEIAQVCTLVSGWWNRVILIDGRQRKTIQCSLSIFL
jgi:hypothetical protein